MGSDCSRFVDVNGKQYEFGRIIGKGAFGKVFALVPKDYSGQPGQVLYALKQMDKKMLLTEKVVGNTFNEKNILVSLVKAPFTVHLIRTFQTAEDLCMVMEFMAGGDLRFHLDRLRQFSENSVRFYATQMILALEHIHNRGIIHRDVKPDNILLDEQGYCNLADFNVSARGLKGHHGKSGTAKYMAPEVIRRDNYDENVDWWSMGVTLYELLLGHAPFDSEQEILSKEIQWPESRSISSECKTFLNALLRKNRSERLKIGHMKSHPFFKSVVWDDIVRKIIRPPFIPEKEKAHCNPDHEFEELFGASKRREKLTLAENEMFLKWNWDLPTSIQYTTELEKAIKKGDLVKVKNCLNYIPVESPLDDEYKKTCLHLACAERRTPIVKYLLSSARADVMAVDDRRWTPLHEAANTGNLEICKLILDGGGDVEALTTQNTLPLHYFVVHDSSVNGFLEVLRILSKNGDLVNVTTQATESPLHYACSSINNTTESVKFLLEHNCDVNVVSRRGTAPLHRALLLRKHELVKLLLKHGAKVIATRGNKPSSCEELVNHDPEFVSLLSSV